ncbi:MAG: TatA/E family twin arginine-targeting protein translocase [bacterium]
MFGIGMPELILIAIVALIIFGPKKLPEVGRALGKGLRELKNAAAGIKEEITKVAEEETKEKPKKGEK